MPLLDISALLDGETMTKLAGCMTEAEMEARCPKGAYIAFRFKGMLVDVVQATRDPSHAAALYREGVRNPDSRSKRRATTHLYYRPL